MGNNNVVASCERHILVHADNCSGFVRAVAKDFGIQLTGVANEIFETLNKKWPFVLRYGPGVTSAGRAARDAGNGTVLVIGASHNPSPGGHGHVAIITGISNGSVLVYGGMLNHPEKASKNIAITSKCWARYKLAVPYLAAEPPYFFGVPIKPPYVA
jgi:hypothetical protein